MSQLKIAAVALSEIRAHGEQTYPHECCGVLLGAHSSEGWRVQVVIQAGNTRTDAAHNRYQISPGELVKIEREARRLGLDIAGFYHSHPDHPAQWSETDLNEAHWLGCSYLITAVESGRAAASRSFCLAGESDEEKRFVEQEILVE
jgi:proteasome lid subunit RPN8/RPN11